MTPRLDSPGSAEGRAADAIVGPVRRRCACGGSTSSEGECEDCKKNAETMQRHATSDSVSASVPPIVHEALRSPGQAPDPPTRAFYNGQDKAVAVSTKMRDGVSDAGPDVVQREVTLGPPTLEDGSITLNASAQVFEGNTVLDSVKFGKDTQEVAFPNPQAVAGRVQTLQQADPNATFHGTVRLFVTATWEFEANLPAVGRRDGKALLAIDTPFRIPKAKADDDTAVKCSQPRLAGQQSSGTGAALDPQPVMSAAADDRGLSVTTSPRVTYQEQKAVQVGMDIPLPLPVNPSVQIQNQAANTQAFGASFTVDLEVKKTQPPSPKPYDCKQAFGPFVIGSDHFMQEDDSRQNIHDWYFGLEPHVRQDLEQGKGILRATGRASSTGSKTFNLELAEKRAKRVRGIITDFAGSDAHLNSFPLGEFGASNL
ncbi:MAG: hypothetical protein ACLQOO_21180 [Terriglobia bacterium]